MASYWDNSVFCSPFAPVLSLDELMGGSATTDEDDATPFDIPDFSPDPLERLELGEIAAAIAGFLATLTPRQRDIVTSAYWLGDTQTAVAARLGISKMAVSKALRKVSDLGRRHLAAYQNSSTLY